MQTTLNKTDLKNCQQCGSPIIRWSKAKRKYCSTQCNSASWKERHRDRHPSFGVTTATSGAISELTVSTELMKLGYEVHRALSPSAHSDVIAIKDNKVYRFEIRTGQYNIDDTVSYPKGNIRSENIAVVTHLDSKIHYFPENFVPAFTKLSNSL